jgi:O-antigen/teichoic acid export membrane protein
LGIIVRQSIINSLITYTGIGLGFVLTIFLYPHILDPDQYGLTRVLISAALICSQFAHLGFHNLVLRYFPFFRKTAPENHGLLFWAFLVPFAGFLVFLVLFLIFDDFLISFYEEQSPLFVDYYLWVIPLTLFVLYFEVLNNYLRSLKDAVSGSFINEVLQRLIIIGVLFCYFFDLIGFNLFVTFFVISYLSQPLLVCVQIWRANVFRISPNLDILRKPLLQGMAGYTLYSLLGGLTTVLVWNIDVIMLGSMAGLASTAVYAIAFYIGSVIAVPQRSIEKIAAPLLSDFIKSKEWGQVESIYKKSSINQLIPGLFIFGLIWLNLDALFMLLPEVYAAGKWVVFIIGIGKLIEVATGPNGVILLNSRHYRVSFYTNILLVMVTIGANYLLIPRYGIEGAAIASAFAIFIFNTVKTYWIHLRMQIQPFSASTIKVIILGGLLIWLTDALISFDSIALTVILRTVLFAVLFLAPVIWLNLSEDLNRLIQSTLNRLKS